MDEVRAIVVSEPTAKPETPDPRSKQMSEHGEEGRLFGNCTPLLVQNSYCTPTCPCGLW